jgi:predicted ATPase
MMDSLVQTLILKRFRSIPSECVHFDNPTFLVGRNGSGKSNVGDAFDFMAEAMTAPLQAVFDKRGGISVVRNRTAGGSYPPNLGLGVVFGRINREVIRARYAFEVRALKNYGLQVFREQCVVYGPENQRHFFDRIKGRFRSNVEGIRPALDPPSLALPVVAGEARFAPVLRTLAAMHTYAIDPGKLREMQDPDSGLSLRSDGSNVASVLKEIRRQAPEDITRIGELLASIVPNTTRVKPINHGNKLSLKFTQEWGERKGLNFEALSMSDGTLRSLGLLAAVFQRPTPTLIVIEEPELTMHPGALGAILDLIRHAARKMQVIVTTHSPDVLDAEWLQDRHIRIVSWHEGATRLTPLSSGSREALQEHLMSAGELLRSNALRGEPVSVEAGAQTSLFEERVV